MFEALEKLSKLKKLKVSFQTQYVLIKKSLHENAVFLCEVFI